MKKIIHTFALLLIVQIASIANPDPASRGLNGKWFDEYSNQDIRIKQHSADRLEVKDLFRTGWVTYWSSGYGKFKDNSGNLIRVDSRNKISAKERIRVRWSPDRYGAAIYFFKDRYRDNRRSNRASDRYNNSRFSSRTYGGDCGTVNDRNRVRFNKRSAEGRWVNTHKNISVSIRTTSSGIKVKRGNNDRWVHFDQDNYNENIFVNDRGSRYVFGANNLVSFEGFDGKRIRFTRR